MGGVGQDIVDGGWLGQPFACVDWTGEWASTTCPPGWTFHCGIDIPCQFRAEVYASRPGSVARIGLDFLGDQAIAIRHDDGRFALYGHLEQAAVSVGDRITARQLIGYAGTRGRNPYTGAPTSTGVHVHFSIRTGGPQETGAVGCEDPAPYLSFPPAPIPPPQEDVMPDQVLLSPSRAVAANQAVDEIVVNTDIVQVFAIASHSIDTGNAQRQLALKVYWRGLDPTDNTPPDTVTLPYAGTGWSVAPAGKFRVHIDPSPIAYLLAILGATKQGGK